MDRSLEQRKNIPSERIVDLQYTDFVENNAGFVEEIYRYFNISYSKDAQQAIGRYIAENPANKHGSHNYKLSSFGLTEQQILDRFSDYINRFDIAV